MKIIREKLVVRSMALLLSLGGASGLVSAPRPANAAAKAAHSKKGESGSKDKEKAKAKTKVVTPTPAAPKFIAPTPAAPAPTPVAALQAPPTAANPTAASLTTSSSGGSSWSAPSPAASSFTLAADTTSSAGAAGTPASPPPSASAPVDGKAPYPSGAEPAAAPAPTEPPPPPRGPITFVEHFGAEAFPDQTRGLYGGSLWLEPSFHGLQWPYMPRTGIGVSGYAWVDNGYETISRGLDKLPNTVEWVQQARAALRVTPTYSGNNLFVQGQLELVGNKDQVQAQTSNTGVVDTDDLWIRFGRWNAWDVKVGRFEGWELYHTGMGLDINTIERRGATQTSIPGATNFERPDYYGVTYLHDRPNGQGVGNIAAHIYPTNFLRVELLSQIGVSDYISGGDNVLGERGALIVDLGSLKVKVGGEYVHKTKSIDQIVAATDASGNAIQVKQRSKSVGSQRGVGGTVQYIWAPYLEFGVSGGLALADQSNDKGDPVDTAATTTYSGGAFATLALGRLLFKDEDLLLGAGLNYTSQTDQHRDADGRVDFTANLQGFLALQYLVARQLFVKVVGAYARSDFDLSFMGDVYSNTMWSGRVRLMYLF